MMVNNAGNIKLYMTDRVHIRSPHQQMQLVLELF